MPSIPDDAVREGSLVEVTEGPLRLINDPHNFGIVASFQSVSGLLYADVVTNTGHHRLIEPSRLCVLSQATEARDEDANSL